MKVVLVVGLAIAALAGCSTSSGTSTATKADAARAYIKAQEHTIGVLEAVDTILRTDVDRMTSQSADEAAHRSEDMAISKSEADEDYAKLSAKVPDSIKVEAAGIAKAAKEYSDAAKAGRLYLDQHMPSQLADFTLGLDSARSDLLQAVKAMWAAAGQSNTAPTAF